MQGAAQLVTVHQANLAGANGQLAVGMRLGGVHQNAARAVHGLDAVLFVIDRGGVHIVFVVIPVAGSLPEMAVHDLGRGDFDITRLAMDLAPVIKQGVLENHAVGQEEREAGGFVAHHEKVHFATDLAMIALFRLFDHRQMSVELFFRRERGAVHARQHLIVGIGLPIRSGNARKLERLESFGIGDMGADAHVDIIALLEEGDTGVFRQVPDMLDLVLLAALFHQSDSLGARKFESAELQVFLHDLLHLRLYSGKIVLGKPFIAQVDIVVEAVVGCGAVGEIGLGIEALDGLGHDMRGRMTNDVRYLVLRDFSDRAVVVKGLHGLSPLKMRIRIINTVHSTAG